MSARGGRRRVLAVLLAVLLGPLLVLLAASGATAHAYLDASNPADGSTVSASPAELRLSFSEHVVLSATRITLTDRAGHTVRPHGLRLLTADERDTEEPATVTGSLPALARGTWQVSWQTLSSDDLHRTAGFLVFGVGTPAAATPFHESHPNGGDAALSALLLAGLAAGLGGTLAQRVLSRVPGAGGLRARRVLRRIATGGIVLAIGTSIVEPWRQTHAGGIDLLALAGSSYGVRWGVREVGLLLLLAAVSVAARKTRDGARRALLVGGALTAALGNALLGHAAAGTHPHLDRVLVTALHLLAALTWSGAVVTLALVITGLRLVPALPVPPLRATLRGFAGPAATCVAVLAVTGVYLASGTVVSVDAALRTVYGRTLLLKLVLVGVAGLLALVNHRHLRGPRDLRVPARTLALEAVAAAAVVLVTAVLVSAQPATAPVLVDRADTATRGALSGQVQDLQETVAITPNRPGAAVAAVTVYDARRPAPAPIIAVTLTLSGAQPVPATSVGDGRWTAPIDDLPAGPVRIRIGVTRGGTVPVEQTVTWTVPRGDTAPPTLVSRAPLRAPLVALSGLGTLLLMAAGGVALIRHRRRTAAVRVAPEPLRRPIPGTALGEESRQW